MISTSLQATLLWQNPVEKRTHTYAELCRYLRSPDVVRFRAAVAYVTWGGLSLIANDLERFLSNGNTLETIFGVDNCVTTPDALLYSVYLQRKYPGNYKVAKSFPWSYVDSEFHPKYFEFGYTDRAVSIIGSGNLTSGGLACNHELTAAFMSQLDSESNRQAQAWWAYYVSRSRTITSSAIRKSRNAGQLGTEQQRDFTDSSASALRLKLPRARRPLFQHILDDPRKSSKRYETLADADTITEKPKRLYLQILRNETGGGHQIQLPVATLSAFFGVGPGENRSVRFDFPKFADSVEVQLTHFENNTHRVRLRPLQNVPRPAIVVFDRSATTDTYDCTVVRPEQYNNTLRRKCTEQTRAGSRHWGLSI